MTRRGVTLTEVLVVIVIIALLIALLVPVVSRARMASNEPGCMTNLRQVHVAMSAYAEANDGYPRNFAALAQNDSGLKSVLRCPLDRSGANRTESELLASPVSYYILPADPPFQKALLEADPNHGLAYCVLHGDRLESPGTEFDARRDTTGLVLRLRRDGSIQRAQVPRYCSEGVGGGRLEGRQRWSLLSDVQCVEPFCDGLKKPCD